MPPDEPERNYQCMHGPMDGSLVSSRFVDASGYVRGFIVKASYTIGGESGWVWQWAKSGIKAAYKLDGEKLWYCPCGY